MYYLSQFLPRNLWNIIFDWTLTSKDFKHVQCFFVCFIVISAHSTSSKASLIFIAIQPDGASACFCFLFVLLLFMLLLFPIYGTDVHEITTYFFYYLIFIRCLIFMALWFLPRTKSKTFILLLFSYNHKIYVLL